MGAAGAKDLQTVGATGTKQRRRILQVSVKQAVGTKQCLLTVAKQTVGKTVQVMFGNLMVKGIGVIPTDQGILKWGRDPVTAAPKQPQVVGQTGTKQRSQLEGRARVGRQMT